LDQLIPSKNLRSLIEKMENDINYEIVSILTVVKTHREAIVGLTTIGLTTIQKEKKRLQLEGNNPIDSIQSAQ